MDTSIENIEGQIARLLANYLESGNRPELKAHGEIDASTNLVSDFTMDSFQVMEFMLEVEDHYDIAVDLDSLSNIHTISDLAGVVIAAHKD